MLITILKHQDTDRRRLIALFFLCFFGMFYFAVGLQIGTTVTLFIQHNIQNGLLKTQLPASIFSTFYPLSVLLLAPFITYLWGSLKTKGIVVNAPARLVIGLVLAILGIGIFAVASLTGLIMTGIILGNLLLGAGELVLTPAVYVVINDLSPVGMKGTMMGSWLLFIALGGYFSSVLASASHYVDNAIFTFQNEYFGEFIFIAGFTFIIVLILAAVIPKLSKMLYSP